MSLIPNEIDGILSFQQALNTGMSVYILDVDYVKREDDIVGGKRCSYAKVVDGIVQALVTFGQEEPINGMDCFSLNYSVSEKYRGRGLALEAFNKGIEDLKSEFSRSTMKNFYVDAIIEVTNIHSINVAKKIFSNPSTAMKDQYSGMPSLYFRMLITIK